MVSGCGLAAAVLTVVATVGVNTSPTFAEEMQGIPVIGAIVRLLPRNHGSPTPETGISVEVRD